MSVSSFHEPPISTQSLGPDATLASLMSLGSLGELTELMELIEEAELSDEAAEPPSDACAIDIVVNAGTA